MEKIERATLTKDEYQESHLAAPFGAWNPGSYRLLALFTGAMAAILYDIREEVIIIPLLGWEGYLLFQIMTGGLCVFSLYGSFYNRNKPRCLGPKAAFSWWGFWLRDFFMALVFLPFAIVVKRVLLSGAGEGLFIDLGGWETLFHPDTPLGKLIPLVLIGTLLVMFMGIMFYVPIWLFYRSLKSLWVQVRHGTTRAVFDRQVYAPGEQVNVQITSQQSSSKPDADRRVYLNYIEDLAVYPPASSKKYKRTYVYTQFQDTTPYFLKAGFSFELPRELTTASGTLIPDGPNGINYWEIIVEEPGTMYWARFLFTVKS